MAAPEGYVALDLVGFTDKGDYSAETNYAANDIVHSENRMFLSLQDNNEGQALPVLPETENTWWQLWLSGGADDLGAITAKDTSNVTGGGAGQLVVAQTLIDAIASKVMNDLIAKSAIDNNLLGTDPTHVLASPQGKKLADQITQLNSNITDGISYLSCEQITFSDPAFKYVRVGKLLYGWFNIRGTFISDDVVVVAGLPFKVNWVSSFLSYQNTFYKNPIRAIETGTNATSLKLWVLDPNLGKQDFTQSIHGTSEVGNVYIGILGIIAD